MASEEPTFEPTMEDLRRGLLAVDNMHRKTWRFQAWCFDRAEQAEPITTENDRTWPITWQAKAWGRIGGIVQGYWLWRWVHGPFAEPPPAQ